MYVKLICQKMMMNAPLSWAWLLPITFNYIRKQNISNIRLNKHCLTGDIKFYGSCAVEQHYINSLRGLLPKSAFEAGSRKLKLEGEPSEP